MTDDLDSIMAVMDSAFDAAFGEAWTRRQVADSLLMPGTHYCLAPAPDTPPNEGAPAAGFALTRCALDDEEVLLFAVAPEWRGRGVGSQLLEQVIAGARARGIARLFLEMRDGNRAESLYLRHGFRPIARRRNYYRRGLDGPHDAITFSRAL